jgi:hypothetical protein
MRFGRGQPGQRRGNAIPLAGDRGRVEAAHRRRDPRHFGPCGDVLQHDGPLLFRHFEKRYTYFMPVTPTVDECLLVPFYVDGKAVGTIWAISHEPPDNENSRHRASGGKFDREDLRMLESLGKFASCAYTVWMGLKRDASGSAPSERGGAGRA